jgi:hypothetical protein
MIIKIFDLDGTLTDEFHPLWNLITEELVHHPADFRAAVQQWENAKNAMDAAWSEWQRASQEIAEIGISMFRQECRNDLALQTTAEKLTDMFIREGIVRLKAIEYLARSVNEKYICVISTGNYKHGAIGFIKSLVKNKLLSQQEASLIKLSGTEVNWENLCIAHMNTGINKLLGLELCFGDSIENLKNKIFSVFVDDPTGVDGHLLTLAKHGFIIPTEKNATVKIPHNCIRACWDDIVD